MKLIEKTLTYMRRSPFQGLAATMIIMLTFLVISVFALLSFGSIKVLKYFESSPQVIAFFKPGEDLTNAQITNIKAQLEKTGKLADFKYVSTHEAEAIYKEKNKDNPLLLELVDANILPASVEISSIELKDLNELKIILEQEEKVDDVVYYEDIVKNLSKWIKNIKRLGFGVIGYLSLESILVILVIIGLQISSKRKEIKTQRLLGANKWFIQKPFVVLGIIYGIVGSFSAWGISYLLLLYSTPFLAGWLKDIPLLPIPVLFMLSLLFGELLLGSIIGTLGALIASNRFLKKQDV